MEEMKNLTEKKRVLYWRITALIAVILIVLMFTLIILLPEKVKPQLFSMPFTLWLGILITIVLVILTYIGGRIYLKDK